MKFITKLYFSSFWMRGELGKRGGSGEKAWEAGGGAWEAGGRLGKRGGSGEKAWEAGEMFRISHTNKKYKT